VDLEIATAGCSEVSDLLAVDARYVGVECLHLRIGLGVDRLAAAAEMQDGRGGDGKLRRGLGNRPQESEVPDENRLRPADLAGDGERGWRPLRLAAGIQGDPAWAQHNVLEFEQEVAVPAGAAELAVGDDVEADVFLQPDGAADFGVLDVGEFIVRKLAAVVLETRLEERGRTHEAADLIGAERRTKGLAHRLNLGSC